MIQPENDQSILDLFFARDEAALTACTRKYGAYCLVIARNILRDEGESEECFNDVLLAAWEHIPPERPASLGAYLARLTRNKALHALAYKTRQKRVPAEALVPLEELAEILPADPEETETDALTPLLERFLDRQPKLSRLLFVGRYFRMEEIPALAARFGVSENRVRVTLFRVRKALRAYLEKENYRL